MLYRVTNERAMSIIRRTRALWRNLFRREEVERDLDAEVRGYAELLTEEHMRRGMKPEEARRTSRLDAGGSEQIKEAVRSVRAGAWLDTLWQDVRYAIRVLRKSPGYTAAAVLTLALGIGANTAIFTVADAALLRSLPYPDANRLVHVSETRPTHEFTEMEASMPDFEDWIARNHVFQDIAGYSRRAFLIADREGSSRMFGAAVTSSFFSVLETQPILGRVFTPSDAQQGAAKVALITHNLWEMRFGGSPNAVGESLILNGQSFTVVGVLPASFQFAPAGIADVWVPLIPNQDQLTRRTFHWLNVIARLKPGVSLEQARAEMAIIANQLAAEHPDAAAGGGIRVITLHEQVVGNLQKVLVVLAGTAGFVLLIACANLANLSLARATTRYKEIAVRIALGARRGRILRQLLTECVVLALLGGAAGAIWAQWGVRLILRAIPPAMLQAMPYLQEVTLHRSALLFTFAVSVLAAIVFGLIPALQTSRPDLYETLKEGGRGSTGPVRQRTRDVLIVAEIALSLVLLVGAGLLMRSLIRLLDADPGFDPKNLLTLQVSLPSAKYPQRLQIAAAEQQLLQKIATIPGVISSGAIDTPPLQGGGTLGLAVEGRPPAQPGEYPEANSRDVSADYFRAMKIPLVRGRFFGEQDIMGRPPVFIINQTLANKLFPNEDPIGQRLYTPISPDQQPAEIVGVVGDEKLGAFDAPLTPIVYDPLLQYPSSPVSFVVRSASDPHLPVPAIRSAIHDLDPELAVSAVATIEEIVSTSAPTFLRRFPAILIGTFAGLALVLAALGIYGVIAYSITQRTREIGIRVALGAQPRDILSQVMRRGMRTAAIGVAVGLVGALALTRVLRSLLFAVTSTDPLTFAAVALLLCLVAFVACYLPARRALRVDPIIALRHE
jgi:predicted permease